MKDKKVKISSPELVHQLIRCTSKCNFDVDIMYGHITIDAKSAVGVFSMDFNYPFIVRMYGENEELETFLQNIAV